MKKSSGKKSKWHVACDNNIENKRIAIQVIKLYFENHPIIKQIQENFQNHHIPLIPYTTTEEVTKMLKEVKVVRTVNIKLFFYVLILLWFDNTN